MSGLICYFEGKYNIFVGLSHAPPFRFSKGVGYGDIQLYSLASESRQLHFALTMRMTEARLMGCEEGTLYALLGASYDDLTRLYFH